MQAIKNIMDGCHYFLIFVLFCCELCSSNASGGFNKEAEIMLLRGSAVHLITNRLTSERIRRESLDNTRRSKGLTMGAKQGGSVSSLSSFNGDEALRSFPDGRGWSHVDHRQQEYTCHENINLHCKPYYNRTALPNLLGQKSLEEARVDFQQFMPFFDIVCHEDMRYFVCAIYTPMCAPGLPRPIGPCREMCESIQNGCSNLLKNFGFDWPDEFNCSRFVSRRDRELMSPDERRLGKGLCIENNIQVNDSGDISTLNYDITSKMTEQLNNTQHSCSDSISSSWHKLSKRCVPLCLSNEGANHPLRTSEQGYYQTITSDQLHQNLRNHLYSQKEIRFAEFWLTGLFTISLLATLFTVLSFLIEPQRFVYPERPIIFLAGCCLLHSCAVLFRVVIGRQAAACEPIEQQYFLVQHTLRNPICVAIAVTTYFTNMASSLWWLVLTLTWFLSAVLKWSQEAIERYSVYFHLLAWLFPLCLTLASLGFVAADPLSGLCYVGRKDPIALLWLLLVPLLTFVSVGSALLITGLVSLFKIRSHFKMTLGGKELGRLEGLMVKIGLFSLLYLVPASCIIASLFYERHVLLSEAQGTPLKLSVGTFALQSLTTSLIGVSTSVWVLSQKTLHSWAGFFFLNRRNKPSYPAPPLQRAPLSLHGLHSLRNSQTFYRNPQESKLLGSAQQLREPYSHEDKLVVTDVLQRGCLSDGETRDNFEMCYHGNYTSITKNSNQPALSLALRRDSGPSVLSRCSQAERQL